MFSVVLTISKRNDNTFLSAETISWTIIDKKWGD